MSNTQVNLLPFTDNINYQGQGWRVLVNDNNRNLLPDLLTLVIDQKITKLLGNNCQVFNWTTSSCLTKSDNSNLAIIRQSFLYLIESFFEVVSGSLWWITNENSESIETQINYRPPEGQVSIS